jgi:putative serine protease PepD
MVLAVIGLTAACSSSGPSSARSSTTIPHTSTTSQSSATDATGAANALQRAFVAVVAKVRPQVVQISTSSGLGSGVIYDTSGDIVTNAHVVGSATTLTVQMVNGDQLPATLVGRYVPDDLAVIKVNGATNLSAASFGNSDALQIGDIVFAVGNPLGLASSVTDGIVSYNGRPVSEGNGIVLPSTIQTSAPINPGNSGGALVDLAGQVIGIPTLAAAEQQGGGTAPGIGFAIPSNTVKLIASQLITSGRVTRSDRAALDIAATDAVNPTGQPVGAIVVNVTAGGSAATAGIVAGDLIIAINGNKVTSLADMQAILAQLAPGQSVTVDVVNQSGVKRTITAVLSQLQG